MGRKPISSILYSFTPVLHVRCLMHLRKIKFESICFLKSYIIFCANYFPKLENRIDQFYLSVIPEKNVFFHHQNFRVSKTDSIYPFKKKFVKIIKFPFEIGSKVKYSLKSLYTLSPSNIWGPNFKISYSKLIEKPLVLWRKVQQRPGRNSDVLINIFIKNKMSPRDAPFINIDFHNWCFIPSCDVSDWLTARRRSNLI